MGAMFLAIRLPFVGTVLASKFAELNLVPQTVLLNGLEAANAYRGTRDAQKFQTTYKMESLFKLVTLASNFWSFGVLVRELGKNYSLFHMNLNWKEVGHLFEDGWKHEHRDWTIDAQLRFGACGWVAGIAAITALICAVKLVNRVHSSHQQKLDIKNYGSEDDEKQKVIEKEVKIKWDRPFNQDYALFLNVAKLSLNTALAVFSSSRLYFAANAALTGYTLYQVAQRKWLSVSCTKKWKPGLQNTYVEKVQYVYRCFLMPFSAQNVQPPLKCTICQDKNPDAYFHGEDVFHQQCLIKNIIHKMEGIDIQQFVRTEQQTNQGAKIIKYYGELPISKMPCCPNCREKPFYNEFNVTVFEWQTCASAKITWKPD